MAHDLEDLFPNLADSEYEITGDPSREYNCIAWALGISTRRWDFNDPNAYWPQAIPQNDRVETIMQLFANEGYSLCDSDAREPGYEKIALYSFAGQFTHVSKQLADGQWSSKLGDREVISHPSPTSLAGCIYGSTHCIMRRLSAPT